METKYSAAKLPKVDQHILSTARVLVSTTYITKRFRRFTGVVMAVKKNTREQATNNRNVAFNNHIKRRKRRKKTL